MAADLMCRSGRHYWNADNVGTNAKGRRYCAPCQREYRAQHWRQHGSARTQRHTQGVDLSWQDDAACQGYDLVLFFGPDGERQPEREAREAKAKEICSQCPVRTLCGDDAIARRDLWGVRGGMNPEELAAERKRRMRRAHTGRAA